MQNPHIYYVNENGQDDRGDNGSPFTSQIASGTIYGRFNKRNN